MCLQDIVSLLSKIPLGFVCHSFLQSFLNCLTVASMRIPVSFDMLNRALCTPIKSDTTLFGEKFFYDKTFCC